MSRKRKCLLYVVFCAIAAAVLFYPRYLYHNPLDVFYASERGMQIGPSDTIKDVLTVSDTEITVIGLWGDALSVVETERKNPLFWGLATSITGYRDAQHTVNCYFTGTYLYGLVKDDAIASLQIEVEEWSQETETIYTSVEVAQIDADGYFGMPLPDSIAQNEENDWWQLRANYIAAYDAEGTLIWQWGEDANGEYHSHDTQYIDEAAEAVKNYLQTIA